MSVSSEEPEEELTELQKQVKAAVDAELKERREALTAELAALDRIDSAKIARRITSKTT